MKNIITGTPGNDTYVGTAGDDILIASGTDTGDVYTTLGDGYDVIDYSRVRGAITYLRGGSIIREDGTVDRILDFPEEVRARRGSGSTISGEGGVNGSFDVDLSAESLSVDGLPGPIPSVTVNVVGFDNVVGTENADEITGNRRANVLTGGGGNDTITGLGGRDTLTGGAGADTFVVGSGDEITDLAIGEDVIESPFGAADVEFIGDAIGPLARFLNRRVFDPGAALAFDRGDRTFLALNDDRAGFQPGRDVLTEITGYVGDIDALEVL